MLPVGSTNPGFLPAGEKLHMQHVYQSARGRQYGNGKLHIHVLQVKSSMTQLSVKNNFLASSQPICIKNLTGPAGTVSCTVTGTDTNQYSWSYSVLISGVWVQF